MYSATEVEVAMGKDSLHFLSNVVPRSRHCHNGYDAMRALWIGYKTQIFQRRVIITEERNTRQTERQPTIMKILVASAFILALVTSNSAEFSNRGAERVGLGLGLPLNSDRSENRSIEAVPDFLLDVHACWSSHSATTNCFSYLKGLPNSLEAANVVWAIKGRGEYAYLCCLL